MGNILILKFCMLSKVIIIALYRSEREEYNNVDIHVICKWLKWHGTTGWMVWVEE